MDIRAKLNLAPEATDEEVEQALKSCSPANSPRLVTAIGAFLLPQNSVPLLYPFWKDMEAYGSTF